jgi:cobalt/nickel transport system permease protein
MFRFQEAASATTGAAIIWIILGPWAAVIAISVALVLQALMFSDGVITAFEANCFNMAVVMPFAALLCLQAH